MNIVGQNNLISKINMYYTMQYLPKTLMFIGPAGCGKHLMSKYVAESFELDYVEINENVSSNELEEYLHSTIDTLYIIDLNKFNEKQQNQFLKFIEEPSKSVYIILLANSEAGVLNTVLNRSIVYHFESYTKEQIEKITNTSVNELAFDIFKTPGKLLNLTDKSFKDILDLANKVVYKINPATYGNTLTVLTKINYKDLYNKIDFNLFFDAVEYVAFEDYKNNGTEQSLTVFKVTNKFKQLISKQNLIKETLMLNYLTNLWEAIQQ